MAEAVAAARREVEVVHPPAISLREAWPWLVLAFALLAVLYVVGVEEGAVAILPGRAIHEFVHDGRHLLAFPCH